MDLTHQAALSPQVRPLVLRSWFGEMTALLLVHRQAELQAGRPSPGLYQLTGGSESGIACDRPDRAGRLEPCHASSFSVALCSLRFGCGDLFRGGGRGPDQVAAILQVEGVAASFGWRGVAAIVAAILADRIKE